MGEYDGEAPAGEAYGDNGGPGEPGEPGCEDQALYAGDSPEASDAPEGENDGPPGVILLPTCAGDQTLLP